MSDPHHANPSYTNHSTQDYTSRAKNSTDQNSTPRSSDKSIASIDAAAKNMPETGKELVRRPTRDDEIYGSSLDSEADKRDHMIRQAPYLPQVQIWARKDGPYTIKVGHQWFHCDDLIINDQEYRQQDKPSSRYQPQQISSKEQTPASKTTTRPSRPQAGRTASQQMMHSARSARDTEERRRRRDPEKPRAPPPREADSRRDSISRAKDEGDYFKDRQPDRDRRNSHPTNQVQWSEPRRSNDSVTPASIPAPTPTPKPQSRPQMPRRISRRSTQDGGILVPVRSKGKRVRFATNT